MSRTIKLSASPFSSPRSLPRVLKTGALVASLACFTLSAGLLVSGNAAAQTGQKSATLNASKPALIPMPAQLNPSAGVFVLSNKTRIYADDASSQVNANLLSQAIESSLGFKLSVQLGQPHAKEGNVIVLSTTKNGNADLNQVRQVSDEAYQLNITTTQIQLNGNANSQFYALQSLLQLLPATKTDSKSTSLKIAAMQIKDQPRFAWRGLHLDVGRHMYSVEFIKKLLDQMAVYKMNTFHWHLTEDQGWRIEIKQYPKLTQVGGFRKETIKDRNFNPYIGDGQPYGGFYTQEQIKDVVAYAQSKHIMVVPEIELPGHSLAAIAAYPELACTPGPFEVGTVWGGIEDIYCPSEQTFQFLENVMTEVAALFPGPYIHIGGDEAPKTRWKASPLAQDVMKREGLKNEDELQSYFIRRVEKMINAKGKRLIGWDEILEGGLAPNATVMSWRGEEGGIHAAKGGHDVIMTPTSWCYFDAGQGPKDQELWNLGGEIPIEKVYSYNPVPSVLDAAKQHHIRGVQANVWTEYLRGSEKVEYMVFPRLLAMAEVGWTPQAQRQFADFEQRLDAHYPRLSAQKIGYRIPRPRGLDTISVKDQQAKIALQAPVAGSKLIVTIDGSEPQATGAAYQGPMTVNLAAQQDLTVKVLTVLADGRQSAVQKAVVKAK
ncbi:family 20 glycosylhydrolase [Undibacterium cyanobacteriorum]|uniref:beta-N-acetylhexosaminidase n=1 Tax=Undibacterium cyanobacteriorum TaxID=3073561 RepID=A0ABY9RIC0_9BURK|nr:family 20 glycosylhydrolase [Undibacterium sp. 20NA77.5]WMW80035.1 family 20 glycosylhydrolase [Undibacterium sp. 20NA77.5]